MFGLSFPSTFSSGFSFSLATLISLPFHFLHRLFVLFYPSVSYGYPYHSFLNLDPLFEFPFIPVGKRIVLRWCTLPPSRFPTPFFLILEFLPLFYLFSRPPRVVYHLFVVPVILPNIIIRWNLHHWFSPLSQICLQGALFMFLMPREEGNEYVETKDVVEWKYVEAPHFK